jgi:hypothetical protein
LPMTFVGIHREQKDWSNRQSTVASVGRHVDRARCCLRFAPVSPVNRAVGHLTITHKFSGEIRVAV